MEPLALVILTNNQKEILLQLKESKSKKVFAGQWSLLEGSMINGELSGELMKGIIENNYLTPKSFKFFKEYQLYDLKSKMNLKIFVFVCKQNIPLLKITLYESERVDYYKHDEIDKLNSPEIIKQIINDFYNNPEFNLHRLDPSA